MRTVSTLGQAGPLAALVRRGELGIIGAYYDLGSGRAIRLHALGL
jgi:hypothetical protein